MLSATSAALLALSFPPASVGPLIFVALVPMLVAQHRVLPPRTGGLALAIGVGGFYVVYAWGVLPDRADSELQSGLVALGVALVIVGAVERRLHEATNYRWFFVLAPLSWAAIDFLRGGLPQVSTWGYPAYALFESPTLVQPVSVTGIVGLNLLVLLVNWSIAGLVLAALGDARAPWRRTLRVSVAVGVGLAAWSIGGLAMTEELAGSVRVAAVQPGTSGYFGPVVEEEGRVLPGRYVAATREAAARGARLVVWPEYGLSYDPRRLAAEELRDLAADTNAYIAIGYGEWGPHGNRNEAVVLTPGGRFLGPYGKQHPVTLLGEESTTRYGYPVHETELGRLATIICYDLDFTDTARRVAERGAQLVAVPSEDWGSIAHKHYPLLVFRAVENRLAMVKADWAYDSAIIDPYGRVVERVVTPGGSSALLIADVPLGSGDTVARRLGDWPGWLVTVSAATLVGCAAVVAMRRRSAVAR